MEPEPDPSRDPQPTASLESLAARVGDEGDQEGDAAAQVPLLVRADWVRQGRVPPTGSERAAAAYEACLQANPWARSLDAWCQVPHHSRQIQQRVADGGWSEADAAVLNVCSDYLPVLAESVRNSLPDYSALLHRHQRILCRRALLQGAAAVGYKHLVGKKGLVHRDPQWTAAAATDMLPRDTSFTSHSSTNVWSSTAVLLGPQGLQFRGIALPPPVVQFVSRPGAPGEICTAVDTGGGGLTFPPLTRFTVVERREPGWLHDITPAVVETCQRLFDGEAPTPSVQVEAQAQIESESRSVAKQGGGDRGRLGISRDALWSWLEEREATAVVVEGEDNTVVVNSCRFDRHDATHQAWLGKTLLPEGAGSTIFKVAAELIVVHAAFLDTEH